MIDTLLTLRPTVFGLMFLPILVATLWRRPLWLLALLPVGAVLQAPAVLTLQRANGGFGFTPFNTVCAFCGLQLLLWQRANPASWRDAFDSMPPSARRVFALWSAFLALTVLGAMLLPRMFEGVPVHPALIRGVTLVTTEPNEWSISHVGQAMNALLLWIAFAYVLVAARREPAARVFAVGVAVAFAITMLAGLQQRLAGSEIVPMFHQFWASNPGYNQWFFAPEYGPQAFPRAALPFVEPSYAAVWFACATCASLALALYVRAWRRVALGVAIIALLGLVNTLGTAGMAAALGGVLALLAFHAIRGHRHVPRRDSAVIGGGVLLLGAMFVLLYQELLSSFAPLRDVLMWTWAKIQTYQGSERDITNRHAFTILVQTWGLGAGAGSTRASSYFLSLLANTGVAGLLLFLAALGMQSAIVGYQASPRAPMAIAVCMATVTLAIGIGLAIPDQGWPVIWVIVLAGFLLAARGGDARVDVGEGAQAR